MTVSSTDTSQTTACAGTTGPYPAPGPFNQDDWLKVYLRDSNDVATLLTYGTEYTVSGAGDAAGGSVTTIDSYASGNSITVVIDPEILQSADYRENDPFPAETHEGALDLLTRVAQRLSYLISRSLVLPDTDVDGSGAYDAKLNKITNLTDPTADQDAATKAYADLVSGTASATAAAASAVAAAASETAAGVSETAAGVSETAAAASAVAAAAAADDVSVNGDATARDMAASALALADLNGQAGTKGAFYLADPFTADTLATKTNATYDASGDYYHNPAPASQIAQGTGSNIGDMTGNGGLAASFDSTTSQAFAACSLIGAAASIGYVGKDYSADPKAITKATVYGSTDAAYAGITAMTITLYGKNTTTPSGPTDGTSLGSISFTPAGNDESTGRDITSGDTSTLWDYVWVAIARDSGTSNIYSGEAEFFEPTAPPNMTLKPTAVTITTANPSDVLAYCAFDPVDSVTMGTDVVGKISIDGGSTWATGTWTLVGTINTDESMYRLDADVSAQTGSSLVYEVTSANNKEVRFARCVGAIPLY